MRCIRGFVEKEFVRACKKESESIKRKVIFYNLINTG